MSLSPLNLRRGAICAPSLVRDPELAQGVARHFGRRATWVAAVSAETYQSLGVALNGRVGRPGLALGLGACRPDPSGSVGVVLALQLGPRQVRCVAPLDDPSLRALLQEAVHSGSIQMAVGPHMGSRYTVFELRAPVSNVRNVLRLPREPASLERQAQAMEMTAALCQRIEEVPSFISGVRVESVDVTVVHIGGSPFCRDAGDRACFGAPVQKESPRN